MSIEIESAPVDWAMARGVIFELNRLALHPRGLHMVGDPETNTVRIRRYEDSHGPYFSDNDMRGAWGMAEAFDDLLLSARYGYYGWYEQPSPWDGGS